ncbi:MAG: RagB/SusD family nutrient uptake outer membrane protein [Bacteroidota bacterium]|nr:RagB/SusD family nutrient uptake outer membrane protein [Bacteroidota bacterium]
MKLITMLKKLFFIIGCLALFAGCKKDPGLVGPTDSYSTTNFPASLNDLNSVLAPCYSNLRDPNLYGFHIWPKALSNATHTANSIWNGDPAWNEMTATNLSITNQYVQEAWTGFYTGIKNCNVTLSAADFYMSKYGKTQDQKSVDYVKGQAYFLRAFYYFNLECLYGESYITTAGGGDKKGVPIFNNLPASLDSTQKGRSTTRQVWDLIISDLIRSAELLKGQVWTNNDLGRISEWAAKGLLGKAYVFTQDWANAKTVLLDVINNSGKTLMPYSKYRDAFIGISANEFNEESLFELNVDQDSKGDYGVYGGTPNATTINGLIWPPWALGDDGTEGSSHPLGYGNEIFHDKNVERFGFSLGYYQLVTNPAFDASKPASAKNPPKVMDPTFKQNSLLARTNLSCDPRLFVNALQPWVDSVKFDGINWVPVSKPNFYAGQVNKYGWSFRKYSPIFKDINQTGPADAWNYYMLRLADVYLLYAEAAKGSGDAAAALEYLNKVKRRAYGFPINAVSPVDYASLTATTAAINDPVLGNNPLYYERFAELFNEGHWWFDLCRWHLGASEAAYYQTALNVNGPLQWNDKTYSWPIPLAELNSNAKMAGQQNPGY